MPRFSIVPRHLASPVTNYVADDGGSVLNVMHRSGCRHADIYRDGDYILSARLSETEIWSLFFHKDKKHLASITGLVADAAPRLAV